MVDDFSAGEHAQWVTSLIKNLHQLSIVWGRSEVKILSCAELNRQIFWKHVYAKILDYECSYVISPQLPFLLTTP